MKRMIGICLILSFLIVLSACSHPQSGDSGRDETAECARLVGAQHDIPYHVLAQDGVYFDRDRAEQFESPNLLIVDEGEEIELTGSSQEEKEALSDLMLFNEMADAGFEPDYEATPFWGYPEKDTSELVFDGKVWTVSNYYKEGYGVPFGQLILVEDGIHWARPQHARLAWDFMKQFRRNEDGTIGIVKE